MEYGININFFKRTLPLQTAARHIAKAGFTMLDYTPVLTEDDWKKNMQEDLQIFADYGLRVHQTHVPFNRYGRYGSSHKLLVDRCAEATEIMGAEFMVIHGDEFDFENLTFSAESALAYNHDYFLPYVSRAAQNGYKVAFETVFEDSLGKRRFTSKAEELKALIMSYESPSAVCCWDFGHGHVSFGHDAPDVIRDFGSLIQCTHLHDNTGIDAHQLPMTGDINWQETIAAFKQIPYSGVMSVEYSHGWIPETLAEAFITLTHDAAEHIWSL